MAFVGKNFIQVVLYCSRLNFPVFCYRRYRRQSNLCINRQSLCAYRHFRSSLMEHITCIRGNPVVARVGRPCHNWLFLGFEFDDSLLYLFFVTRDENVGIASRTEFGLVVLALPEYCSILKIPAHYNRIIRKRGECPAPIITSPACAFRPE